VLAICASFRASSLIGSSGLIITAHTSGYLFCPPVVVHSLYANSHIIKNENFLAYFMRILKSCVVQQVSNCHPWMSAIPAAYLLCSIAIRRDVRADLSFAALNCADLASFYSHLLTRCRIFLQLLYKLLRCSVDCCVFLRSLNLKR